MYRALLRELGYPEDFDLAELEITLEGDGRLQAFEKEFKKLHSGEWQKRRQLGLAINEASAVLNKLDPKTYPSADSYAQSVGKGRADIDPNRLARRAFELMKRRQPNKGLLFIIDEVGQYVSRSVDKMLDLMGIIQAFGVEGKNRTERREAPSPLDCGDISGKARRGCNRARFEADRARQATRSISHSRRSQTIGHFRGHKRTRTEEKA
jgi:hypothetical protein